MAPPARRIATICESALFESLLLPAGYRNAADFSESRWILRENLSILTFGSKIQVVNINAKAIADRIWHNPH